MIDIEMDGVTEYAEGMPVILTQTDGVDDPWIPKDQRVGRGRLVVQAKNEGGFNCTHVDILQLVAWLKANRPDLLQEELK